MHKLISQMINLAHSAGDTTARLVSLSRQPDMHDDLKVFFNRIADAANDGDVVAFNYHMSQPKCWGISTRYPERIIEVAASHGLMGAIVMDQGKKYVIWPDIYFNKP